MNLTELQAEIYSLTNRPDLVADTLVAIRAATLKAHHSDFYYKDCQQAVLQLQTPDFVNTFDTTLLLRYRSMAFLRKWYPSGINVQTGLPSGKAGKFLTARGIADVLDSYGRDATETYYIAGTQVNINMKEQLASFLVGWYSHPDISTATYTSWIAQEHPYAIVFDAASTVFKGIGYDEQSTRYGNLVSEQFAELKMSNIEMEVR